MIADLVEKIRPRTMADLMPKEVFAEAFATGGEWAPVQYSYYWALARLFRPKSILEIGVLGGCSLASMLMGAGPKCRAVGWDIEGYKRNSNDLARHTMNLCGVGTQAAIFNTNSQSVPAFNPGFAMIHVDGAHDFKGASHDLDCAIESGAETILFDDIFNVQSTECKAAADAFLLRHASRIVHHEVLPTTTGLLVIKLAP